MQKKLIAIAATYLAIGLHPYARAADLEIAARTVAVDTFVKTDVDATWNELVSALAARDYTVDALLQENRTLKVLFQSTIPSHYVDCGEISVSSKHSQFGDRSYNFLAANSVRYLVADERVDELVDVERRTNLNVVANISLVPMRQGTLVRVDADYVMNFRTREFGRNIKTREADDTLNFHSAVGASRNEHIRQGATTKSVTVECRATGALERNIVAVLGDPG